MASSPAVRAYAHKGHRKEHWLRRENRRLTSDRDIPKPARLLHRSHVESAVYAPDLPGDAGRGVLGLAPLACETDKIDAWVLAELSRRDLVPAIWLPDFAQRAERERARWRLHLVKHRSQLKHRVHSALMTFGHACPVSDLFGAAGGELLGRLDFPDPWRSDVLAAVALIDDLNASITAIERELHQLGAEHRYVSLLQTVPGVAWVLGYTIAAEIGDITRFASPAKLAGYTGLCPRVRQSGGMDRRGPLAKNGPKYLRWAVVVPSEGDTSGCVSCTG
jgi:transposase